MNLKETEQLLRLIEAYDRTPFRPEAVDLWYAELRSITYADADAAVRQIFRIHGRDDKGNVRKLLPADVRRPAEAIGEHRRRMEAQRAIGGAKRPLGLEAPAARAALEAMRKTAADATARYRDRVAA